MLGRLVFGKRGARRTWAAIYRGDKRPRAALAPPGRPNACFGRCTGAFCPVTLATSPSLAATGRQSTASKKSGKTEGGCQKSRLNAERSDTGTPAASERGGPCLECSPNGWTAQKRDAGQ